jgi:hypothetical protein
MSSKKKLKLKVIKDKSDDLVIKKGLLFDVPFRILLVMKTGMGKSNTICNFFRSDFYGKEFNGDDIYIISPMINDNKLELLIDFKQIPDDNVITTFDNDLLNDLYDKITEEFSESVEMGRKPANVVWIVDDMSWSGALKQGYFNIINKVFCNGRKHNISILLSSQYYTHILSSCRSNASGLILGNASEKQLKLISEENNFLENEKMFRKLFRSVFKNKFDYFIINYSNDFNQMYMDKDFNVLTITDK